MLRSVDEILKLKRILVKIVQFVSSVSIEN